MHSLILCSLNRISCGAVVNWYKRRLSNVHTILKKNALCVHTYSLAYTLTHVSMISPQEKKKKKKNSIHKHESYPGGPNALTFAKIHLFLLKALLFRLSFTFYLVWKKYSKGKSEVKSRSCFPFGSLLNQRVAIWTMRFPGKHLLYRENNTVWLFWAFECAPVQ